MYAAFIERCKHDAVTVHQVAGGVGIQVGEGHCPLSPFINITQDVQVQADDDESGNNQHRDGAVR